jgi:hypothetical protein
MRTTIITTALATAAVAAVTLGGAAHAEDATRTDPRDTTHGSDIRSLRVAHHEDDVVVVTKHEDLRRDPASGSGGAVYLDTDPGDAGPEYVLVGGYFVGTDYVLLETDGFRPSTWGEPVEHGDYLQRVRYGADTVRTVISRAALGDPEEVRVSVKASGPDGDVDWVGAKHSFTPWIAQ